MTLNLTFLGVLKRLKTDLSSQAQIQLWFVTYIWISYIWSHNDEHYLSSSETVPEKNSRLYIWTHYLCNISVVLYQLSYRAVTSQLGTGHFVGL